MTREQQTEHVAKAIRRVWGERSTRHRPRSWDKLPAAVRRDFMKEAAAAMVAYDSVRAKE